MRRSPVVDRRLLAAARLVENLAKAVPEVHRHVDEQLRLLDGFGSGSPEVVVSSSSELTSVERAADERLRLQSWEADIEAACTLIAVAAADALRNCERVLGMRVTPPRCSGGMGRDGHLEWGDPACDKVRSRGPLCDACAQREYRWRVANGMPPRGRDGRPLEDADPRDLPGSAA